MTDKLNISLEPHLRDMLAAVLQILPEETSHQLTPHLSPAMKRAESTIPYDLVLKISRWCQATNGRAALQACSPPLDPQTYTMVSLLAGARTSPEKHFAPYIAKDSEEEQRLRVKDKKAIATLVNAVLSIVGTGVAAWWAGEHTGMRLEWRALSAVGAALVVAFAEIVLYMIWDSRQVPHLHQPARQSVVDLPKDIAEGMVDLQGTTLPGPSPRASSTAIGVTNLRHRTTASTNLLSHDVS